ncbi:sperm-tail PG-rich repeat-containing protein 2-like [Agrilus planipennis]|uniref:Sperm-tail PG-rich repeat-containing protein 2-like n=1 Tax=Agrilus planipennis TaxID=224129 RepID=A0A1W4WEJ4_AGRPL|nr:sperm-tail PG-rich repeat-containing protein 2-like [Agrilus planipennis]
MYHLAPRFQKHNLSGTPEHVGPDTYTICFSTCKRQKNRAPFLSCEGRKFSIARPVYTHALYSYDTRNRIIGGASINYTAERKTIVKTRAPGPGDYEPKINVCRAVREIKGKGRVYLCRVPYSHEIGTPSIPTRINENGYNIINGRLDRIPPDDYDETIGPAFYCVPSVRIATISHFFDQMAKIEELSKG